jgi:hypothetical protein
MRTDQHVQDADAAEGLMQFRMTKPAHLTAMHAEEVGFEGDDFEDEGVLVDGSLDEDPEQLPRFV